MELISKNPDAIRLFLSGDIMLGRGVDQILKHSVDPTLSEDYVKDAREYVKLAIAKNGPLPENRPVDYVWGDALKILKNFNPDIKVANLNTAVTTNHEQWSMKGIHYRMHPKNVEVLQAANFDCVVLANAHILDYNYKGLEETIDTLKV
jgi:poly-gamma-glutamate capsule biosynthesis protein CapA/YwtB (metallophosphatase superfamily)